MEKPPSAAEAATDVGTEENLQRLDKIDPFEIQNEFAPAQESRKQASHQQGHLRNWLRKRRTVKFGSASNSKATRRKNRQPESDANDERHMSRCEYLLRIFCTLALTSFGLAACVFAMQLFEELVTALRFPLRSLKHRPVDEFEAPAIVIFLEKAHLESCNNFNELQMEFWNNASDWKLRSINCSFISVEYNDPYSLRLNDSHPVLVFRGPSRVKDKETIFLHFVTHGHSQDFYTMSFLLMHNFSEFSLLSERQRLNRIAQAHAQETLHTASAGLRLWGKISMTQLHVEDDEGPARTLLDMESNLAASFFSEDDPNPEAEIRSQLKEAVKSVCDKKKKRRRTKKKTKQFFLFFEWKSGLLAESHVVRAQSIWSVGASLCGVLLTLHKGYSLAAANVRRLKRTRDRRQRTRQFRKRRSMQAMMEEIAKQANNDAESDDQQENDCLKVSADAVPTPVRPMGV